MKKIFLAITAIAVIVITAMWFAPLAQAVTVNGERQVGVSSSKTVTPTAMPAYQQQVVAATPVAYQQPVPEVTSKQFEALKAKVKDLEKKQVSQSLKNDKIDTAVIEAKEIGNQAGEKAKEASEKADKNSALLEEHRNWMVKMKEAHDITANSVRNLVKTVNDLVIKVSSLAQEIKNTYAIALAGMIIAIFAGIVAAACFIFGLCFLFGKSKNPEEEPRNFKK